VCSVCVLYQVFVPDDDLLKVKTCRIKRFKVRCVYYLHHYYYYYYYFNYNNNIPHLSSISKLKLWTHQTKPHATKCGA